MLPEVLPGFFPEETDIRQGPVLNFGSLIPAPHFDVQAEQRVRFKLP